MKKIIALLGVFSFLLLPVFLFGQTQATEVFQPLFTNDATVLGILICVLGLIFWTDTLPGFKGFYKFIPTLLLCYFLPAVLNYPLGFISPEWFTNDVIDFAAQKDILLPEGARAETIKKIFENNDIDKSEYKQFLQKSNLYYVASRYLLPASLILLCISIDFQGIKNLGPKALIMFGAATLGIVIGGPIALIFVSYIAPGLINNVTPDELWRGLSTIAGSWIGGGANQTAMKEIFEVKDNIFASMIVVDVIVANIWMAFLLYGAGISDKVDKVLKADNTAIEDLKKRVENYSASIARIPTTTDVFIMLSVAFGGVALAHWGADFFGPYFESINDASKVLLETTPEGEEIFSPGTLVENGFSSLMSGFFWLIIIATTFGLILSFTKARKLEGIGASRWGSVFIYILVATIGMKMNLGEVFENLGLFAIGLIWMLVHVIILLFVAWLIKAPFFFVAVGSQANVGGAASAPIVASAFSPALAPVGVLMAVLGYALGTYGALICAWMMQAVGS